MGVLWLLVKFKCSQLLDIILLSDMNIVLGGFCRFCSMFNEMEFIFIFLDGIEWKKIIYKKKPENIHKINRFRPTNTHKEHAKRIRNPPRFWNVNINSTFIHFKKKFKLKMVPHPRQWIYLGKRIVN